MNVAVIGTGYVGLVVGACLAESGNDVICADIDEAKITRLRAGEIPIYEPGLEPIVARNVAEIRLAFTTDVGAAVRASDIVFIAVGTPPGEDGSADLKHVLAVAETIGSNMNDEKVVITKSTVPVGTAAKVRAVIRERATEHAVHICSNPEFLKEGAAVDDFMKPDRVVIGVDSEYARERLGELYAPFVRTGKPILFMDVASAEITKYAANAMLASRISFMNTVARLCAEVGADVDLVRKGIGTDGRIGAAFLFAGIGYGGSCFPKDVKALIRTLREHGVDPGILEATERVNESQKRLLLDAIEDYYGEGGEGSGMRPGAAGAASSGSGLAGAGGAPASVDLDGRTFAVWGLSFKPGTDDMREAPSLVMIEGLLERGATVRAHDPQAVETARRHFGDRVEYVQHNYDALDGADALVILTEWQPYRRPDFDRIRTRLSEPVIFDGRNLFDPARMRELGFEYVSIGRGYAVPAPAVAAD